ncbi:hypothetical protein H4219_001406 [Mycoemilia scoparia]|uniref:LYR motif-containing protein Cup1-like N-terminal domain-containing protein n=1 Tax=Mycoemilia scoparia TaxID=417184 RepID=A0A9W8A5Z8_9FUNG|nr:hypothetical protein H4219_001406 [Mycoemilia scoparia]
MLRLTKLFHDDVHRVYLKSWIRERFRDSRRITSPKTSSERINEAKEVRSTMKQAIEGDHKKLKYIDDLAYGRRGRIAMIIGEIKQYKNMKKPCRYLKDMRSLTSIKHDSHPAYAIPFDQRIFKPDPKILQLTPEFIKEQRIKNAKRIDPKDLVIHKVVTTYGFWFYRIKGRKQPNWLGKKIKELNRQYDKRTKHYKLMEEYLEEMAEEERFLNHLGVDDHGYSKYTILK